MSESKHTPWEIVIADDNRMFIAEGGDIVCHPDPNHEADDQADARRFRLIAAAPDLLEALRLVLERQFLDQDHDVLDTVLDAIAKAEGRS